MRINSISVRLNYSLSWQNKLLPGRSYNKFFIHVQFILLDFFKKIFEHKNLKNLILLSQIKLKVYSNQFFLINLYIYIYKYIEVYEILTRNKILNKNFFLKFLADNFLKKALLKTVYVIQNSLGKMLFKINFIIIINRFFRAELVSQYIVEKLKNKFKLTKIISSLGKNLIFSKKNKGMLIQCSGRFDRKERASYQIFNYGKISMNTFKNKISYNQNEVTLKYGVCGIKVWLLK